MALKFKLWASVEVYDSETDEHTDIGHEMCEFKIFEADDINKVAEYIGNQHFNIEEEVLHELKASMNHHGFMIEEDK